MSSVMVSVSPTFSPEYWKTFALGKQDTDYLGTYLFENETPLTEKELLPILIHERFQCEREAKLKQRKGDSKTYLPKEHYQTGDQLAFPALDWRKGKVTSVRPGVNPALGEFNIIQVEFDDGSKLQFATDLAEHKLNQPEQISQEDERTTLDTILSKVGEELEQKLKEALQADESLVRIAGRWFPRALLVEVNIGHLNLAEAVLDEADGRPLPTSALIEQVELPSGVNPTLIEFSMNYALQEDGRFDEVGPAGEVLWCLRRLEPGDVQQIPAPLRYQPIPHDREILTPEMRALELELNDELSEIETSPPSADEVVISLTYPHWRAGTLPVSPRVVGLFPTAYESPRVYFTLVDGYTGEETTAWVVRQQKYVSGLSALYKKYGLIPGNLLMIRQGRKPGQVIIQAKTQRTTRDWVRTVLVGSDGGLVFAMLKQNINADYNERMIVAVPDEEGVDQACLQLAKENPTFDQLVMKLVRELAKLNVQGHVHAQELYSALNIVRRCPPAPLLAFLARESGVSHVGDLHYRPDESEEGGDG